MTTNLTPEQLAQSVTAIAAGILRREGQARTKLAETLAAGHPVTSHELESLLSAQSDADNWRRVLAGLGRGQGAAEVVRQQRERLTERLLEFGESRSTSMITNDIARMERDAARSFLETSRGIA
jgi:hypothetical protein